MTEPHPPAPDTLPHGIPIGRVTRATTQPIPVADVTQALPLP